MLSAVFWVLVFIAVVVAAMSARKRMADNKGLRSWYERAGKDRINLLKKIVIYGTVILWAGIWLVTRGDEKASIGSLLRDYTNTWSKSETQVPAPFIKE